MSKRVAQESVELPAELAPSRYVEKVDLKTDEVIEDPIHPHHLLVHSHRDYHLVDVQARTYMSRLLRATGDEDQVRKRMKEIRSFGHKAAAAIAKAVNYKDPDKVSKKLFGLKERHYYFRYKRNPLPAAEVAERLAELAKEGAAQFDRTRGEDGLPKLRVLLTGGTGFVGKELLWQAADDESIVEAVVLIRPKEIRNHKTKELIRTLSPAERGEAMLDQLWLESPQQRAKFRFVAGDVEQPGLGIAEDDLAALRERITHVVHSAASVSFDDPYEASFRANVTGSLNALRFSHALQEVPDSPFVSHIAIETSYIHGRQTRQLASEDEIVFPRNFYNNYYELTKAMASIETERFMLSKRLRVVQLCPAIVIGESRAGNNRGDTKVVNAPVNVFGRAHEALSAPQGKWFERTSASLIARMACIFPGDPSARLNLIPVDWVARGILAAIRRPQAIGERVHLATDNHITSEQIRDIVYEELDVRVHLAEPTMHRNVTLPILTKVLSGFRQERLAHALDKLGTIFGGYSEWGQPIHEVGKDVEVLGMPDSRPNTLYAFRMLCRHNRYVQEFGAVRDLDEISRRERAWWNFVKSLEGDSGEPVGSMSAADFRAALAERLNPATFELRERAG
jgi:nucleoside-diphosphate-sugar epimerase